MPPPGCTDDDISPLPLSPDAISSPPLFRHCRCHAIIAAMPLMMMPPLIPDTAAAFADTLLFIRCALFRC